MNEITTGIRSILSHPSIYNLFQFMLGDAKARNILAAEYIKARDGDTILDIGCGTAETRLFLGKVEYYGFDPNPDYIESAKRKFRDVPGCNLYCKNLEDAGVDNLPEFDIVLAIGVLHHLDDQSVIKLAQLAHNHLKSGGRLITVDPCYIDGQSLIARYLASRDRGQHVRMKYQYENLLSQVFSNISVDIRNNLSHIPYTHIITQSAVS